MVGLARVHLEGLNVAWERSRGAGRASQCSTGILAQSENKFGTRREAVNLTKHHETTSLTHGMDLGKCPRVTQMAVANNKLFVKGSVSQTPLDCQWSHKEQKIPNLEYKIFEVPRSGLRTPRKYQNEMEKGGKCFLCRSLRLRTFRRVEVVLSETVIFSSHRRTNMTFLWRHGASSLASLNLAITKKSDRLALNEKHASMSESILVSTALRDRIHQGHREPLRRARAKQASTFHWSAEVSESEDVEMELKEVLDTPRRRQHKNWSS